MASLLSSATLSSRFLQLPPALRASTYQAATALRPSSARVKTSSSPSASPSACPRRAFSATASRPAPSINEIIVSPFTFVLDSIHAIGLPWYAAIPAAAVLFRSTVGYYFSALPARKRQIARWSIMPLMLSKVKVDIMAKEWNLTMENKNSPARLAWERVKISLKVPYELGKQFKVPHISGSSFVGFGLLIGFGEAIRIKCGAGKGMVAFLVDSVQALVPRVRTEEPADPYGGMSKEEYLADRLYKWREAQEAQAASPGEALSNATSPTQLPPMYTETTSTYTDIMDPSLKTEGFLWFQDLTLPDPTFGLPIIFIAAHLLNALVAPKAVPRPSKSDMMARHNTTLEQLQAPGSSNSTRSKSNAVPAQAAVSAKAAEEVRIAMQTAEKLEKERQILSRKRKPLFARLPIPTRLQLAGGFIFAMVSSHFPAAILLYIIPSMFTTFFQRLWLNAKHPLHEQIAPCKRPMRVKLRREYVDKARYSR